MKEDRDMSTVATKQCYTPEDLLAMPDAVSYELVNGELVEREMGWKSSRIGGRVVQLLLNHCDAHGLGWVAGADASYQCFPDAPNKVRKPDASFIRLERIPADKEPEGHCRIAPDLAVEVTSSNDLYEAVENKVVEYLTAGVRLVWVVHPPTRTVRVHRADGTISTLRETDELSGEDVVPGFRCRVSELFAVPVHSVVARSPDRATTE
jgi:Uma2 family endonuclease